jgi:hypothetical protein
MAHRSQIRNRHQLLGNRPHVYRKGQAAFLEFFFVHGAR